MIIGIGIPIEELNSFCVCRFNNIHEQYNIICIYVPIFKSIKSTNDDTFKLFKILCIPILKYLLFVDT